MEIFEFEIPSHTTRREWAVYVIKALNRNNGNKIVYVGKVGDNREGCNPIISRIGNHFSHNRIHSQMRNKISKMENSQTIDYDYKIFYSTFGEYVIENQLTDKDRVNELERQLNRYIQQNLESREDFNFINPYKGIGISKNKQVERSKLLTDYERQVLKALAERVTN